MFMLMVWGIIKCILKFGCIKLVYVEVVCEGEIFKFDFLYGDCCFIYDFDLFDCDLIKIKGLYVVVIYENGMIDCEFVLCFELDKIWLVVKIKNVWDNWFLEKFKVVVIKCLVKWLDLVVDDLLFVMNCDEIDFVDE